MSTYRKFSSNDLLHSIVCATPHVVMASGTQGWRGNVGVSSSLSLYGGIRKRPDVRAVDFPTSGISVYPLDELDTHSIDKVLFVSGSYPATGSVRFVKIRNSSIPAGTTAFSAITSENWYEEHFRPIELAFTHYAKQNPDYFTGSYDYRSLYLRQNVSYQAPSVLFSGSGLPSLTSSLTCEIRVKPTQLSGTHDFTLQSQRARWKFFITGSNGRLAFSDFATILTSSVALSLGRWQHLAVSVGSGSASFYVDSTLADRLPFTGSLASYAGNYLLTSSFLTVGAESVRSGTTGATVKADQGFSGFLFESRVWRTARTQAQISSSYLSVLHGSGSSDLLHYARFNDGALSSKHGYTMGSGAFDYSPTAIHGQLQNIRAVLPLSPVWQPNDDGEFIADKVAIHDSLPMVCAIHVPSLFYGRQIATGSVRLVCNAYNGQGFRRVLVDDRRGGLYVSGSLTRAIGDEDFLGVTWNKVGNVLYTEGLIVITDPSLYDFGEPVLYDHTGSSDLLEVSFDGVQRIATKVFMCRSDAGEGNASNNSTFSRIDPSDPLGRRRVIVQAEPVTYITAIGLYDQNRTLVAVAKIAQPVRKRERDRINIRLRFDF